MKFFAVFSAILAVALGANHHWTLDQLSEALENPTTNPSLVPILEQALNTFMQSMFAGESHQYISITTAPVDLNTWSLHELSEAIENPNTNPALLPYLENALNAVMNAVFSGQVEPTTAHAVITIPALEISYWTIADIEQALVNPATSAAMIPYLEQALNHMMVNIWNSVQGASSIVLAIPLEIVTPTPAAVAPEVVLAPGFEVSPVQVVDAAPEVVLAPGFEISPVEVVDSPASPVKPIPVSVSPVESAPVFSGSPLVQIILNINQKESAAPEAVITPTPVSVPDNSEAFPNPRPPVPEDAFPDSRPPVPEVVISPEPVILPSPPTPDIEVPQPEPVIIAPDYNPIDAIAVAPPEINPVDLLHPVIQPVIVAGGDIGPM